MARSFHPHPIVGAVKIFIIGVLLCIGLVLVRNYIERVLITLLLSVMGITLALMLVAFIAARFHTITLEENTIIYRAGIISLRKIILPYSKITEASYTQGLIQRVFGVGTLNVDTAGGSFVAIHLNDVRYADLKTILGEINGKGGKDPGF